MAARDSSETKIECPKCGKKGIAQTSTGDHPYMKSNEYNIDELPDGFELVKHSKWIGQAEIQCTSCKVPFKI